MITSESVKAIAPAFLKAQKAIKTATKDSKNPYFKNSYASLGAVIEACKEALNENGIFIMQPILNSGRDGIVQTTLMHESGEYFACETPIVTAKPLDAQAFGAAITYARRYGLQSLLCIPTDDDDGEAAVIHEKPNGLEPISELTAPCKLHEGQLLREFKSPKTGNLFFGHKHEGNWCFGKVVKN